MSGSVVTVVWCGVGCREKEAKQLDLGWLLSHTPVAGAGASCRPSWFRTEGGSSRGRQGWKGTGIRQVRQGYPLG